MKYQSRIMCFIDCLGHRQVPTRASSSASDGRENLPILLSLVFQAPSLEEPVLSRDDLEITPATASFFLFTEDVPCWLPG